VCGAGWEAGLGRQSCCQALFLLSSFSFLLCWNVSACNSGISGGRWGGKYNVVLGSIRVQRYTRYATPIQCNAVSVCRITPTAFRRWKEAPLVVKIVLTGQRRMPFAAVQSVGRKCWWNRYAAVHATMPPPLPLWKVMP